MKQCFRSNSIDQDLSGWNVSPETNVADMFNGAAAMTTDKMPSPRCDTGDCN